MEVSADPGVLEPTSCEGLHEHELEMVKWEFWRNMIIDLKNFQGMP